MMSDNDSAVPAAANGESRPGLTQDEFRKAVARARLRGLIRSLHPLPRVDGVDRKPEHEFAVDDVIAVARANSDNANHGLMISTVTFPSAYGPVTVTVEKDTRDVMIESQGETYCVPRGAVVSLGRDSLVWWRQGKGRMKGCVQWTQPDPPDLS